MSHVYMHILNTIKTMVFLKTMQEISGFCHKSFAKGQFLLILEHFTQKSVETANQRNISKPGNQEKFSNWRSGSCLCCYLVVGFFKGGLSFSAKYISYDFLKIFLSFRITKKDLIWKFALPHNFILLSKPFYWVNGTLILNATLISIFFINCFESMFYTLLNILAIDKTFAIIF